MYDSNAGTISTALSSAPGSVFTPATIQNILSLVSTPNSTSVSVEQVTATNGNLVVPAGTELAFVSTSNTAQTTLNVNTNTPVLVFQGNGGVNVTLNAPATGAGAEVTEEGSAAATNPGVVRVVVGSAGADKITIADNKNTEVIIGDKDTVTAGKGYDVVTVTSGATTVVGGGHTVVKTTGIDSDYLVYAENGHAKVVNVRTSSNISIDISKAQYVQLENNDALIFAKDAKQAAVAHLFEAVLGHAGDAASIDQWFAASNAGAKVSEIAQAVLNSAGPSTLTNAQWVDSLYTNLLGRAADAAGHDYWVDVLSTGASRANVLTLFAEVAANPNTLEATIVGSVDIINGIV